MVVTTVVSDLNYVAPPTITGTTPFLESTNVTLSAADGTSIYYTTDGSEPTNTSTQYTASFSINTTSTIKAIAYINGNASLVASKDFSQVPMVDNIAAFKALSPNTIANLTLTNAQVLNADATNTRVYVRDNSG
ncbi:MAG: FN3 associated domain-containing protein, partial [Prevotella sp.]|nr:FN3 associated domain-containing protein [Prevotella sp.]